MRAAVGSQSVPFIKCSRAPPSAVPWARPRLGALVEQRKRKIMGTSRFLQGIVLLLQVHHARPGIHHVRQRRVRRPGLRPRLLRSTPIPAFLAHASGTAGPLHSSATHCAVCDLPFPEAWACACACGNGQLEGQTPCSMRVGCDETRDRARPLTARLHGFPLLDASLATGLSRAASSF